MDNDKPLPTQHNPATLMGMSIFALAEITNWSEYMAKTLALLGGGERAKQKVQWNKSEPVREYDRRVKEWFANLIREVTLGEVLLVLEEEYRQTRAKEYWHKHKNYLMKIGELGLNRLDSIALPPETITLSVLQALPRERLLALDGRFLAPIGEKAMEAYRLASQEETGLFPPPFTVGELLANPPERHGLSAKEAEATQLLLKELGFTAGDGLFMEWLSPAAAREMRRLRAKGQKKRRPRAPGPKMQARRLVASLVKSGEISAEVAAQLVAKALEIKARYKGGPARNGSRKGSPRPARPSCNLEE